MHYYVWRWYSQIAGGSSEVIRHAIAGERGNDITTNGNGFTGTNNIKFPPTIGQKSFTVLVYSNGAAGTGFLEVAIPFHDPKWEYYNNEFSKIDFRGEGFRNGSKYNVSTITMNINDTTGKDEMYPAEVFVIRVVRDGVFKG